MSCIECTDCPSIGTYDICCDEILVATDLTASTDYLVRILDLTLNRYINETVTSDASGNVSISITQAIYAPNRTYEVKVYADATCSLDDPIEFEMPDTSEAADCVSFELIYAD